MNMRVLSLICFGISLGCGVSVHAEIAAQNLRIKSPIMSREAGAKVCVEVLKADGQVAFCLPGKVISTQTSNPATQRVASDDLCVVVHTDEHFATTPNGILLHKLLNGNPGGTWIYCSSGKLFTNVGQRGSAATGTPGFISYGNYIGTIPTEKPTPGRAGSGMRVDFCDGECTAKTH